MIDARSVLGRSRLVMPAGALLIAVVAGWAISKGGSTQVGMAGVALAVVVGLLLAAVARRYARSGIIAVEVPVVLLATSTLVLRQRTALDIAYNPLDPAAQIRVACIGAAGLLGAIAWLSQSSSAIDRPPASWALKLYTLYVPIVFIGAPLSVSPALTAYRGLELVAALVVFLGARAAAGARVVERLESTLYWFVVALVFSVWIGAAIAPSDAFQPMLDRSAPIPWEIRGVLPSFAANGVGTLGVLLVVWSLARSTPRGTAKMKAWLGGGLALLGLVTLLVAQYRTGYVALVVAISVFLVLRRKYLVLAMLALAVASIVMWRSDLVGEAQPFVLRGQSVAEAEQLSGRVDYWRIALPVWQTSPWIGRGLLTATRYEIFSKYGLNALAGLHSTWVEALVGTGLVGVFILAAAFLAALVRAGADALRRGQNQIAFLILVVLGVRSITGNTFESVSLEALLLLWSALAISGQRSETV